MNVKDIKVGMKVVLNSLLDAQVYQVKSFTHNQAMLTYIRADGREVNPMPAHPSMIFEPTAKQLENLVSNKKIISGSAMLFNNDEGDWSEAFEPSDYDNIDHLDNAKISWSVDAAHISLARKIMQKRAGD